MTGRVDLHTHSVISDGTCTPSELAELAKRNGLTAVALTDHDATDGTDEFIDECSRLGIEGIKGIEISTKFKRELHIVGLYVGGETFDETVLRLRDGRKDRNIKMLEKLRENGFEVYENDIVDKTVGATIDRVGRLHIAKALVKKGYVKTVDEAFDKLLSKGKPCHVSRFSLSPKEGISLIKNCGGIAIWAHPIYTADSYDELRDLALEFKGYGLDALECYYSRYTDDETAMCLRLAEETGLAISGGSDFHGDNKPDVELGKVNGGSVPYSVLEKLKTMI